MRIECGRRTALTILLTLTLAACQPPASSYLGAGMDMFAPVSVRLHKLSRIVLATPPTTASTTAAAPATRPSAATAPAPAPTALEARIELLDQFADQTKTPGIITLALFDQPPATHKGDLIQSWTFSLNGTQDNSKYWDRTMRGYFFKLPLIQTLPKREHLLLTVSLMLPNGLELTDEMELPVK